MSKFKVGDKVRWVAKSDRGEFNYFRNAYSDGPFTVTGVRSIEQDGNYIPQCSLESNGTALRNAYGGFFGECWLEPVPALITLDGKYQTRDGRAVRIFALDGGGEYPVLGAYVEDDGTWGACTWTADGRFVNNDYERPMDLIPAVEKPKEYEAWVNVYAEGAEGATLTCSYTSRAFADAAAASDRIDCVHLKRTYGEGL